MIGTNYRDTENHLPDILFSVWQPNFANNSGRAEAELEARKQGNGGQRPPRNPRDTQVLLCAIAGIVIGIAIGVTITINAWGTGGVLTGIVCGFVAGGLIGTFVGEYLKKRKYKKIDQRVNKDKENQGPILK